MQGIIYEESSFLYFLFLTCAIGGATAWMTGRACAITWRPQSVLFFYVLLLAAAVRFVHFAVFGSTLLSPQFYIVDLIVLLVVAFAAFHATRTQQMIRQYYWLYERSGPFSFRPIGQT